MDELRKFVAEWNAESSKRNMENYIRDREEDAAYEAEYTKSIDIAKKMLNDNFDIKSVSKYTGLSISDIEDYVLG